MRPDVKAISSARKTHRSLHKALAFEDLEAMKGRRYAKNTEKKFNSACMAKNQWREDVLDSSSEHLEDIALSDIMKPRSLEPIRLCNSLCRFITEVRKVKGGDYPPQSVHRMIISIQMYLHTCRINWKLLSEEDPIFVDLYNVVENLMKECTEMGLGKSTAVHP